MNLRNVLGSLCVLPGNVNAVNNIFGTEATASSVSKHNIYELRDNEKAKKTHKKKKKTNKKTWRSSLVHTRRVWNNFDQVRSNRYSVISAICYLMGFVSYVCTFYGVILSRLTQGIQFISCQYIYTVNWKHSVSSNIFCEF